jgi:WD40 repeat protein
MLWEANTGQKLLQLVAPDADGQSGFYSAEDARENADGNLIATLSKKIGLFDRESGDFLRWIEHPTESAPTRYSANSNLSYMDWSPDGQRLLTVKSSDATIYVWDAVTGEEALRLAGHEGGSRAAMFSPDGSLIASYGKDDRSLRIWDAESGAELFMLPTNNDAGIYAITPLAFSPDGRYLAYQGQLDKVWVWDFRADSLVKLPIPTSLNVHFAWHPGSQFLSVNNIIYDAVTGKEIMTLPTTESFFNPVSWNPDGNLLLTQAEVYNLRIWPFPPLADVVANARARLDERSLSDEERQTFFLGGSDS